MKLCITLIFFLLLSCSQVEPKEIQILNDIINRDFDDCPTFNKLIPISVESFIEYETYLKLDDENNSLEKPTSIEIAPSPNLKTTVSFGYLLFSNLINNLQITRKEYEKIFVKCNH